MNLFDWLLVGHLIGDFLFQTGWMAKYKAERWLPLIVHSSIYTFIVALAALCGGGLSIAALVVVFIGHLFLDRKSFVGFWVRVIQNASGSESKWLSVMTDQIFHIILLAAAICLTGLGGIKL